MADNYKRIFSDLTAQQMLAEMQKTNGTLAEILASMSVNDANSDVIFAAMLDDTNTSDVFKKWYATVQDGTKDRYGLLERFFTMCAMDNDQVHTVRFYSAAASSSPQGTPLDWLADKQPAALATDTDDGGDDWASENRMTWYIRANAIAKADGTMNVIAIEGEPAFDITGGTAPVFTFQLANWYKEEFNENYEIYSWRATRAAGYRPFFGDVAPDGTKRVMTWHSTFPGSLTADGKLTSGAGRRVANYMATTTGLTDARKWEGGYFGLQTDCDSLFFLREWQHRHFTKENGGQLEGCTSYNYQYTVALPESNTMRVLVTTAQGANFIVGSCVIVGDRGTETSTDRNQSYLYNLSEHSVEILDKNDIEIEGEQYTELVLNLDAPITTTATTLVSTMPWNAGQTEKVIGHRDGSPGYLTGGKYPMRVAGIELLCGAYDVGLEPLYQVTQNADGTTWDYAVYECKNATKQAGSITSDYTDTGITLKGLPSYIWQFIKELQHTDKDAMMPKELGGSDTTYYMSGFYSTGAAGPRVPARRGRLSDGGPAGLACCSGNSAPSWSAWNYVSRLAGNGAMRGEWVAE